ncbi:Unconventional myosin-XVIIIa-like PROTEIN [Lasiodiplodia theobromae]|uniref:Unconventional myosin-XVIIIa-like PROTEIN n=1 Tax=Lasiodiplodia theobromae TaxID=45133 RepID=UPI0015C3C557|nr:Unconventional myosin-XVIIIa-like PROTEIN [Lasiodiplodia theobromae]KAF4545806.1 Unconventional myosin-XVIIIa-like PROTEIN [Lasiodiplodia theobromae]
MNVVTLIRNAQYVEAVRLLEDCGPEVRDEGIFLLVDLLQLTMVPHWLQLLANLALSLYSEHSEASEAYLTKAQELYNKTTSEMCFPWLLRQLPVVVEHIALSRARVSPSRPENWPGIDAPGLRLTQTQIDDYFKPTSVIQMLGTGPRINAA